MSRPTDVAVAASVAQGLGARLVRDLGGRQRHHWLLERGHKQLVLRRYLNPLGLSQEEQLASIVWEQLVQRELLDRGLPVATPICGPWTDHGTWWTVETALAGEPQSLTPARHAAVWAHWQHHALIADLPQRPHPWRPLAVLDPGDVSGVWDRCGDEADRWWLVHRHEQLLSLAECIDWSATSTVLVHGDLTAWNLHWTGPGLSGVLDLELTHHDRRTVEAVHIWRCRYDRVLVELHQLCPLNAHEWRMVLLDWWATLLSQARDSLTCGHQPGRWTLDGLRRESPLSQQIIAGPERLATG